MSSDMFQNTIPVMIITITLLTSHASFLACPNTDYNPYSANLVGQHTYPFSQSLKLIRDFY